MRKNIQLLILFAVSIMIFYFIYIVGYWSGYDYAVFEIYKKYDVRCRPEQTEQSFIAAPVEYDLKD